MRPRAGVRDALLLPGDLMSPMDGSNHSSWTSRLPLETGSTWVVSPVWFTELLGTIILYLTESLPGRFYLRMVLGDRNPARRYSIDLAPSSFATAPHTKFEDWDSHWLHQKQYIIRMRLPTYAFSDVQSILGSVLVSTRKMRQFILYKQLPSWQGHQKSLSYPFLLCLHYGPAQSPKHSSEEVVVLFLFGSSFVDKKATRHSNHHLQSTFKDKEWLLETASDLAHTRDPPND